MKPFQIVLASIIFTTMISSSSFATTVTYTCPDASDIVLGSPVPVLKYDANLKRQVLTIRWSLTGYIYKQVEGELRKGVMPIWGYMFTYANEEKVNIQAPPIVPDLSNPVVAYFISSDDSIACKYQYGPTQSLYYEIKDSTTLYGRFVGNCPNTSSGPSIQCTLPS